MALIGRTFCLLVIAAAICLIVPSGSARADGLENLQEHYFERRNYQAVADALTHFNWKESTDPILLEEYCFSFRRLHATASCLGGLDEATPPRELLNYARGLSSLWSGESEAAYRIFNELEGDARPAVAIWGTAGLLEYASYTGNYTRLARELASLRHRHQPIPRQLDKLIIRSQIEVYENTANWRDLRRLVSKYSKSRIANSPDLLDAEVQLLLRDDRLAETKHVLDSSHVAIGSSERYQMLVARYMSIENGRQAAQRYLRKAIAGNPNYARLRVQSAYLALQSTDKQQVQAALQSLLEIAKAHQNDVQVPLEIALSLTDYRERMAASQIVAMLKGRFENADTFTVALVIDAWNNVYRAHYDIAKRRLQEAMSRAPYDRYANWLWFLIEKKEQHWGDAASALVRMYDADPYDENVVYSILDLPNNESISTQIRVTLREIKSRLPEYRPEIQRKWQERWRKTAGQ